MLWYFWLETNLMLNIFFLKLFLGFVFLTSYLALDSIFKISSQASTNQKKLFYQYSANFESNATNFEHQS